MDNLKLKHITINQKLVAYFCIQYIDNPNEGPFFSLSEKKTLGLKKTKFFLANEKKRDETLRVEAKRSPSRKLCLILLKELKSCMEDKSTKLFI